MKISIKRLIFTISKFFKIRDDGSGISISVEPLLSPSLSIWFGRKGHWSILNDENQERYAGQLCSLLRGEEKQRINDEALDRKVEKMCSRIRRFVQRAFRPDKKCFR